MLPTMDGRELIPTKSPHVTRKGECLGSWGSMVASLKLKGIDGRAHKEWSLRLNLTQHGKTYRGMRG